MPKQHKYAGSHVAINTALSGDQMAAICKSVGETTKGNLMIGVHAVRFEGANVGRLNFSIRALGGHVEYLTFHVNIEDTAYGSASRSQLDTWKTKQDRLLMVIPAGPKRMLAYKTYRLFMSNLMDEVRRQDPRAKANIYESKP